MQGPYKIAELFDNLMDILGYETYAAQGGDWGSFISRSLGLQYPTRCRAIHCTMLGAPKPDGWDEGNKNETLTAFEAKKLADMAEFYTSQPYLQMNARTPQTFAFSLADSPVGLLGLFYEKLSIWVDKNHYQFADKDVLDAVMMHWINGPETGIRLYQSGVYSNEVPDSHNRNLKGSGVLVGCSLFHYELAQVPKAWAQEVNDIVFWHERDSGGHVSMRTKITSIVSLLI